MGKRKPAAAASEPSLSIRDPAAADVAAASEPSLSIRDRITRFTRVPPSLLRANPKNWRMHPDGQRKALEAAIAEIGFAGAVIARETPDGLELLDGHLRLESAPPDSLLPVLVVDLDDAEADKFLLTYDPLSSMAAASQEKLAELASAVEFDNEDLADVVASLIEGEIDHSTGGAAAGGTAEVDVPDAVYQVLVECETEAEQQRAFELLEAASFTCRVQTL